MSYKIITLNTDQTSLKEVADGEPIHLNLPQYSDDSKAKDDGLEEGDWYQDDDGVVKIVQP